MDNLSEYYNFLLNQRPVCTQSPLKVLLGTEMHKELRSKYNNEYGFDILADRCPNTFLCKLKNQECIGRPFPVDSLIEECFKSNNMTYSKGVFRGFDVFYLKTQVECSTCPFKSICDNPCASQESYMKRRINPDMEPRDHMLVPYEDYESGKYRALDSRDQEYCKSGEWSHFSIPWDCLTDRQRQCLEMKVLENLTHSRIGYLLGISSQAVDIHIKYAKKKLEEYGKARSIIFSSEQPNPRVVDYYVNNLTNKQIASKEGSTEYAIEQFLYRWKKSNLL